MIALELVHAVLSCIAQDGVDGAASISWRAVLADMLDAPVAELAVSNNVNALQDFVDARTLQGY